MKERQGSFKKSVRERLISTTGKKKEWRYISANRGRSGTLKLLQNKGRIGTKKRSAEDERNKKGMRPFSLKSQRGGHQAQDPENQTNAVDAYIRRFLNWVTRSGVIVAKGQKGGQEKRVRWGMEHEDCKRDMRE